MKTALLRAAWRNPQTGERSWEVPGFAHRARLRPASASFIRGWGPAFYWPAVDEEGELVRSVDLSRNRSVAKFAAENLILIARERGVPHVR